MSRFLSRPKSERELQAERNEDIYGDRKLLPRANGTSPRGLRNENGPIRSSLAVKYSNKILIFAYITYISILYFNSSYNNVYNFKRRGLFFIVFQCFHAINLNQLCLYSWLIRVLKNMFVELPECVSH